MSLPAGKLQLPLSAAIGSILRGHRVLPSLRSWTLTLYSSGMRRGKEPGAGLVIMGSQIGAVLTFRMFGE